MVIGRSVGGSWEVAGWWLGGLEGGWSVGGSGWEKRSGDGKVEGWLEGVWLEDGWMGGWNVVGGCSDNGWRVVGGWLKNG